MTAWKMLVAVAVAAVGFSSRADAQVSVSIPGVGSATFGNGSTYYSPYSYGYGQSYYTPSYGSYVVPAGFATSTYNYPAYSSYYYPATTYTYPTTYGTTYTYPTTYSSGYSYPMNYGSGYYSYPSYNTSGYYPSYSGYYNTGYYNNPGWGWNGYGYGNTNFGQGFQSGVVQGALGVPNWYGGYGGYWGGSNVQGTVGNYLGRELGRAIFD